MSGFALIISANVPAACIQWLACHGQLQIYTKLPVIRVFSKETRNKPLMQTDVIYCRSSVQFGFSA
ncbi:hypothetical protein [Flavobacterium sp. GT3R68]|uniref:hypothetical protein n=1 Tax=Flavobacterium sp. GT3R68 TaxID=2594437 RepID=UPI00163DD9DC|nr:hypothetical protein [Flavobacterium sp. GT3R68]